MCKRPGIWSDIKNSRGQGTDYDMEEKNGRGATTTQIMEMANGGDAGFKFYSKQHKFL
ncbi:hypothetical protein TIFTF001_033176, partial [Ficus carica]